MVNEDYTLEKVIDFIANRIHSLREASGQSAHGMSVALGQNISYINKIENQTAKPSIEGLYNICEYFGVTFKEFFDDEVEDLAKVKELLELAKDLKGEQLQILIQTAKQFRS